MPRKGKSRGSANNGDSAIARKLEAKGLGVKFTRMKQNVMNPHSAPLRRTSAKVNFEDPIKDYCIWPAGLKPETNQVEYIKLDVSVRALVEDNMAEVQDNYAKHALGSSSYIIKSDGEFDQMRRYFYADKLGLKDIPQTETVCWKVVTVTTEASAPASTPTVAPLSSLAALSASKTPAGKYSEYHKPGSGSGSGSDSDNESVASTRKQAVKTTFYQDLQVLQKNYYMLLRGSIPLYMDDDGKKFYRTIMMQEDTAKDLTMDEKYLPGKRITWEWIKNMIYTKMCCRTNGNYFYSPLLTVYRRDGQTRYDWCDLISGVQADVVAYKHGYDKLGSQDAVEKLWDWLCPEDEQPVVREYYKRSHTPPYLDTQSILSSVTLTELISDITLQINKSEWPKRSFLNKRCKAGRAKLLYGNTVVQKLRDRITELESSRGANKRRTNHAASADEPSDTETFSIIEEDMEDAVFADEGGDTGGGGGGKKNKQRRKRKKKRKQKNTNKKTKRRNQARSEKDEKDPCPKCLEDGLGIVRHNGECDGNKRTKAIAAMKKKLTDTGKHTSGYTLGKIYKARKQGRTHKALNYPPGACKWCIAWGWDPKFSKHPDSVCIYIKDGPLHKKLGGTYENMYSSKLDSNFYKMRSQVFAERREKQKNHKRVKFSGKT